MSVLIILIQEDLAVSLILRSVRAKYIEFRAALFGNDLYDIVLLSSLEQGIILLRRREIMLRHAGYFLRASVCIGSDPDLVAVSDPEDGFERLDIRLAEILVDKDRLISHAVIGIERLGLAVLHYIRIKLPVAQLYAGNTEPGILLTDDRLSVVIFPFLRE